MRLCTVEGPKSGVYAALDMIRVQFPLKKYSFVSLKQINFHKISEIPSQPQLNARHMQVN